MISGKLYHVSDLLVSNANGYVLIGGTYINDAVGPGEGIEIGPPQD